jgi:ketosteroid isomerase-like protein
VSLVPAGAESPEELEAMLEDACLLSDAPLLTSLFDDDAVLLTRACSQVRGRQAIVEVIIDHLGHGCRYVAAPQLVMQCGRLALIISCEATSVARRGPDGWHYVISRLDLIYSPA